MCKGELKRGVNIARADWVLKHPDRLILEDGKEYLFRRETANLKGRNNRLALRNFLGSKGDAMAKGEISGRIDEYGKLGHLCVPRKKLEEEHKKLEETLKKPKKKGDPKWLRPEVNV